MDERIVGHWKLDEISGSVAEDSTSNENNGTVVGTAIETGILGNARVFFSGSSDRVEVGDLSLYDFGNNEFTLSTWISTTDTPANNLGIIAKRDDTSNNNSYSLTLDSNGFIDFSASSDGSTNSSQVSTSNPVNDGQWHLVTITRSAQDYNLYIDGTLVDTNTSGISNIFSGVAPFSIGNYSESLSWDRAFDGYIDDVKVFNYELTPEEVNDLFYNTPFDAFPPIFQPISPVNGETKVLVDTPVVFIYSDENPDLTTLNFTMNDFPIIENGLVTTDGYFVTYETFSEGFSDGYDGYKVTIEFEDGLPERSVVDVEIDGADAYGSFAYLTYTFSTASSVDPPPKFVNFNPLPFSSGHNTGDSIFFQFNDGYDTGPDLISGINLSTLQVAIDGDNVVVDGVIQSGFSGTITNNGFDGVNVTLNKDGGWRPGRNLYVTLYGEDNNGTSTSEHFFIRMGGGPVVQNELPADGYIEVLRTTGLRFEFADAIFGVNKEDLQVVIHGLPAITNGVAVNDHSVQYTELEDGYLAVIEQPTLPEYTEIVVEVVIVNRSGHQTARVFSFETVDETPIIFEPVTPEPDSQRIDPFSQIIIDALDGYSGPDAYSIDISINDMLVVSDGYAISGYEVNFDHLDEGSRVRLIRDGGWTEFTVLGIDISGADNHGNSSSLFYYVSVDDISGPVITDRVPDDNEKAFAAANVTFNVHDSGGIGVIPDLINVTVNGAPAITNGTFQAGFTGSINDTTANGFDGYSVTIDPDDDFTLNTIIPVFISVKDGYGNESTSSYSFEVDDVVAPVVVNLDPDDGGTSSLRPFVRFGIHDTGGTGVDPSKLQMTIDGVPAITNGNIAPHFAGLVDPTTVNGFDGYNVFVRWDDYFVPGSEHFVVIDGYDAVGNYVQEDYSFFAITDTVPPEYDSFSPEPGETGVPLNSAIAFSFNDADGYVGRSNIFTLNVSIDGTQAVKNGLGVNGYDIAFSENILDGYDIEVFPPSNLPEFYDVLVELDGYDASDNFASFQYSFRTADISPPLVEPVYPKAGSVNVPPLADIIFKLLDGYSGIDLDTIDVSVDNHPAIVNGEIQDGYDANVTSVVDGYQIELVHSNLAEGKVALIAIDAQDAEGNLRSFTYSFTVSDITGPDFDAITPEPFSTDIPNHSNIKFNFIDYTSGVDINTLGVAADGVSLVVNGMAEPGIQLEIESTTGGYTIEVKELVIVEGEEVEITLDGYDNAGNYNSLSYFLAGAFVRPLFSNFNPLPGEFSVPIDTDIEFDFTDAYGVSLDDLEILINDAPAVISGEALDGYVVTYAPITDGYRVTLELETPLSKFFNVTVDLFGRDNNGIEGTFDYSFKTVSDFPPDFLFITPAPFSTDQNEEQNISFTIDDPADNGIFFNSINVYLNFQPVILGGDVQDGYFVEISPNEDGYNIVIEHPPFEPFSRVFVSIEAITFDGNPGLFEYYYDVGKKGPPQVIPIDPLEGEIGVPSDTDVVFEVRDINGVDLNGLTVTIDGIPAFRDSSFLFPFDDTNSDIEEITDDEFRHFEDLSPVFIPVGTFYPPVPFHEVIYVDTDDDFDGYIDGYVDVDGYIDGYFVPDGYQLDGYADDGYDGYISVQNVGYRFTFDKRTDYKLSSVVTVEVHAADLQANEGDRSYAFSVVDDTGPPLFVNADPFPDEENVGLGRPLTFDFIDIGSGAFLSTLDVTLGISPAIVDGEFQDGYSGFTEYFRDSYGDGYHVTVYPDDGWPNHSTITVSLYGEDCVGNSAQFDFSFLTEDVQGPVFENIFPAPDTVDVQTDTAIRFEFNDTGGSGTDIDTLGVRILGSLVVIDGNALDGYVIEITPNDKDGYDIQLFMPEPFPEYQDIDIVLTGSDNDGNFAFFGYSWFTADETGPVFDRLIPRFPDAKITGTGPIFADIIDPHSGVDFNSIGITIDGVSYVDSGVIRPSGFVTELIGIDDGYRVVIESIGPLSHDIDNDTVALWRMDSVTSTIPDATGNSALDGTVTGATSVSGMFGNALSFDGSNDRVQVAADSELRMQDFSIEAWINPTALTGNHVIYTYNPRQTISESRGVVFRVTSTGALAVDLGNGSSVFSSVVSAPGLVPIGSYSHVATVVSRTDNSVKFMVDGSVVKISSFPISSIAYNDGASGSPSTARVLVGARVSPFAGSIVDVFNGKIDDLRISDGPRTISSIANSYNRGQSPEFAEFTSVFVDLFARDNVGNDGYISYFFNTLDETPPVFSNFNPSPGDIRVDINTDISFDFTDVHSGPNLDSLNVTVDGKLIVGDGLGVEAFIDTTPIVDGYSIVIDLDYPLPEFKNIIVTLDGYDIDPNQTIYTYQFSTDDLSEPVLDNEIPPDGSEQVNPFTDIKFDIHDTGGSGVQLDTVNVQIDDRDAIVLGETQENWYTVITPTFVDGYDGYNFCITADRRYALDSDIRVLVDGYDAYGNYLVTDFAFHTFIDEEEPEIVNLDPVPFDIEIALNSSIVFDIIDGYDVDLSRLDVHVDNNPAIIDGAFQLGYEGASSGIEEITDGYHVEIDPEMDFFYNHQVTVVVDGYDFSDNHVHFEYYFTTTADTDGPVIDNRNPDSFEVEVDINSDVSFDITDAISGVDLSRLDVHVDSMPAVIDGAFQAGYDGPSSGIETILDGYHVVVDPIGTQGFDFNQIIVVTIDGYDFADNHTNDVYWFATIADVDAPSITNLDPFPGEVEVPVDTDIAFDITDTVSGVDMTRLDVYVNDVPAVTDGVIKAPWSDPISKITPITDGYRVVLDQFVDFGYNELQTVVIDGYDYADNHVHFVYDFLTKVDVNGPTIIPIDPVDTQGDVTRSPTIEIRITDDETGVDFDRFDLTIDNILVMEDGEFVVGSGFDGPYSQVVQRLDGYDITIDSTVIFDPSYLVRVVVDGYDYASNQTHFEYTFAIVDDEGPLVFDFHPEPNSVDAEGEPLHVSFGIRDRGDGEVDLSTLLIEVSDNADEPFITTFEPVDEFQNGWTGAISNQPNGDGYVIDMYKDEQAESFAVFTFRITAADNRGNVVVNKIGKEGGLIDSTSGTVSGFNTIDVGEFFINSNQLTPGDMAVIVGTGAAVVDGYTTDEIVFDRQIAAGGTVDVSIFRGSFMTERRIFRPQFAEATSVKTVDLTFSDPPVIGGTELSPGAYTITGGDYPINVVSVLQQDDDTFELTFDVPMQALVGYTVIVDSVGIVNEFGFTIDDGYESVDFTGFPDIVGPRVQSAINEPFNVNVTVIFNEAMTQDSNLTNPNNYLLSDGAIVKAVTANPKELDRVILTVDRLFGQPQFDVFIATDEIRDYFGNKLDLFYNHAIVTLNPTTAALSGITGRVKSRNAVRRMYEDHRNWYLATSGGIDVISKIELENLGFVLDGYGFNAITADPEDIYFGRSDGYIEDAYGVRRLSFDDLNRDSSERVQDAFNEGTSPSIPSNEVNDLYTATNANDRFLAVATVAGATLIKNSNTAVNYSYGGDISSIHMDDGGSVLYLANNTLGRVEVYYDVHTDIADRVIPDAYYSVITTPEISNSTISQIKITNNTSIIDDNSNSIYVATDYGLTVIHTDESIPGSSETGGISFTYGTEGSGATFEILGGQVDRVVAVDVNLQQQQAFVATKDTSLNGGVTTINLPSNTRFQFASQQAGTLVNNDVRDIVVKNL